jgi:hypothetical protein
MDTMMILMPGLILAPTGAEITVGGDTMARVTGTVVSVEHRSLDDIPEWCLWEAGFKSIAGAARALCCERPYSSILSALVSVLTIRPRSLS